jgi:hypothetical protein
MADDGATEICGARTVFWPDDEACEAECCLSKGHEPVDVHEDRILGEWSEDEMVTT